MKTLGTYSINEILPTFAVTTRRKVKKPLGNFNVKANSERLVLFNKQLNEHNKIFCVSCNLEATHFKLETSIKNESPHFNLYSSNNILFTKDHIIAKSKGGLNTIGNYQVMCETCNRIKGNS